MEDKYYGVLLEEMSGNIKRVLEGHAVLENKIEALDEKLSKKIDLNTVRIEALDEKLSNRINEVEKNLTEKIELNTTRIDAVATDLAAHRRDTELHRGYQVSEPREKKM